MQRTMWLLCACFALCPAPLWAQPKNEAIVVFKDGFVIKGRVAQPKETIFDPYTGQSFTVPSGSLYMDDMVRRMMFCPTKDRSRKSSKSSPSSAAPSLNGFSR